MINVNEYTPKYAEDKVNLIMDFSGRFLQEPTETISDATFTITCVSSLDPLASAMVNGTAHIDGYKVGCLVSGGVAGKTYELACLVHTSGGRILMGKKEFQVQ